MRSSTRLTTEDLRVGARFLRDLPRFLRSPISLEEARATVKRRFAARSERLTALVDETYSAPASPYARLMRHAGVTPADVAESVARDGIEATLSELFRAGVYLTVDELKGSRPVARGTLAFEVDPSTLVNRRSVVHGVSETSGSRGPRTPVPIDLASIADHAVNTQLALAAHGGNEWRHAHYGAPGGTAVSNPLEHAKAGRPPDRWFTPVELTAPGLSSRYRIGSTVLRVGSALAGMPLPGPTFAPLGEPAPIVRWIERELASGRTPHVWTFASSAVLICRAASESGSDVRGARFTAGGEPTTAARRAAIEASGAVVLPRMGTTETDIVSYACAAPDAPDDMHFFEDRLAVIQPGEEGARDGLPPAAMLLSTLLPTAPILMLNVSLGDHAVLERRSCGCGMESEGWTLHIHHVRSFEKLVAGGVALLDVDVDRVLEEVLPSRFGGRPTDYQLVERLDGENGRPEVRLLVHPGLGPIVESAVIEAFLDAIGSGSGGERMMALQWRSGGVLAVERRAPLRTASGKILHLHCEPGGGTAGTSAHAE